MSNPYRFDERSFMTEAELVEQLLTLPDLAARRRFLEEHRSLLNDEVARLLDLQAAHFLRADVRISIEIAHHLNYMAELVNNPLYKALGLVLEADARGIGLGEYELAIALYDEAVEIYKVYDPPEQAWAQVGKVSILSHLGRYAEALEIGHRISPVLEAQGWQRSLAMLTTSLGNVYSRRGEDLESLAMYERAGVLYQQLGRERTTDWALIQNNRAYALRNLGRFDASIEASKRARDALLQLDEKVEAARVQQYMARTYFVLGRFNEALELLDHVREVFLADGRKRDAMMVELQISDCLLELRRFPDVLEKCQRVRSFFAEIGSHRVEALALFNEAVAYIQLRRYEEALNSLSEARKIFAETGNQVRAASTDLETSAILLCQARYAESLAMAQECVAVFKARSLPIEAAQAFIVAARAALALKEYPQAYEFLNEALQVGEKLNIPTVRYQGHALLGALAAGQGDVETAQKEYDLAIQEVEQLRGRLMVEFRVSFLEGKENLYEEMVRLCIDQDQPLLGLEYAERAKSRALLDLLAYRLDLTIQAKDAKDEPLVEELMDLRAERDRHYRRWESNAQDAEKNEKGSSSSQSLHQEAQQEVLILEKKITDLWHRLLVRNADYARDAALWAVRTESAQPYLDEDTVLVEYYIVHGKLVVFLVTDNHVQLIRLDGDLIQIKALMQRLRLNLRTVPKSPLREFSALTANAQAILHQLHQLLIAPLEERFAGYSKLILVPHDSLHYLPFHALYDGNSYLIERYEISYLPNSSSLRYCREVRPAAQHSIVVGHSNGNRLPHAVEEARTIASLLNGQAFLEEQASRAEIHRTISDCRTLHLAAHGDFRLDNPLFSGLALADGWLTTMDIFNLRLKASLVTLSACQTGRNVLGGGDELLGLMRAFISRGTASVALTLWAVEDRSTAQIMETFYRNLVAGRGKGESLRQAQLQFIRGGQQLSDIQEHYAHPYFWAPFALVGDAGPL
ncbi:MAG TPA: CHAT domain-containing tetratricopeptide repeat protein [Anaerolineales bacterium]|nr:CHAT domain-containing tetratricopeptide repeat protein [Anaerolineales bacterium]